MFESFWFMLFFAVFNIIFATVLFKKAAGTLSILYPNVISLTYYMLLFFHLVPSFLFGTGLVSNWWVNQARDITMSSLLGFYATFISFLLLPMAIIIFQSFFGTKPKKDCLNVYRIKWTTLTGRNDKVVRNILFSFTIILTIALIILFYKTDRVPLWNLLLGTDAEELALLRGATNNVGYAIYIKNIFGMWFSPTITLICFGYYLMTRRKKDLFMFLYNFLLTFLYLFYSLAKAPILWFFIMLYIYYSVYKGKLSTFAVIGGLIIGVIVLVLMYTTIMGIENINAAIDRILQRVFYSQYVGTILTFDYFPRFHDYLMGGNFIPFGSFLDLDNSMSFSLLTMRFYNPVAWSEGAAGYMATQYIAEAYANFSYPGILIGIIIVAFWISLVSFFTSRLLYHPISISLIVLLMVNIPRQLTSNFKFFFYSPEIIMLMLTIMVIIFLGRGRLVIKLRKM